MKKTIAVIICVLALVVWGVSWKTTQPVGVPVTMTGITDASGNFTYAFPNAYTVPPNIQGNAITADNKVVVTIQSITTTGFTIKVERRNTLLAGLLGNAELLLATTTPVSGAQVDVLITSKQ